MKIYINGRFLSQSLTGVNRYAYELTKNLNKLKIDFYIIVPKNAILNPEYDVSVFKFIKYGIGRSHFWEQIVLPFFFIFKRNYVLLNFTGLSSILIRNRIMTIHDLAFLEDPKWYSNKYYYLYKYLTPIAARTAKKIITVSLFSKNEIIRKLKIREQKISVIYNAVDHFKKDDINIEDSTDNKKYILTVASMDPRKNFKAIIDAFLLLEENVDIELYIVGGQSKNIFSHIDIEKNSKIHILGRVTDKELEKYYRNANMFIYMSFYEGFGIPPLEAMRFNCPVIVSDIPIFHEVYDDAVVYISPYSILDISNGIKKLYYDKELRAKLIEKGEKQVEKFSWEYSSYKIIDLLNEI